MIISKLYILKCRIFRGDEGQKFWEYNSEITGEPKGPLRGSTFWSGFEAQYPYVPATTFFPQIGAQKIEIRN